MSYPFDDEVIRGLAKEDDFAILRPLYIATTVSPITLLGNIKLTGKAYYNLPRGEMFWVRLYRVHGVQGPNFLRF